MFAQIIFFPERASTTAERVDRLGLFLLIATGSVALLVAVLLIGFAVRYRRRPGQPPPPAMHGNTALEIFWTVTPLLIFLVMFFWGASVFIDATRAPDDATTVYGIGKQWMWKFQHPEGQREINALHVPQGQPIRLLLTSEDVIHSFFVAEFRIHMDVIPNRYTSVWFNANRPGTYHLLCSQYCGTGHSKMVGTVHVMEPTEYQKWLNEHAEGSLALEGRKTFLKYRCVSCHGGDQRDHPRAPLLEELYLRQVPLRDGRTVLADDDYIRRSIYYPGKEIVVGYEDIMPNFRGQVSEEEVVQLIAYIRSLGRGQTPKRVEEYPPPATTPPINSEK
jgi:cytochrome c oxidase subunit 2